MNKEYIYPILDQLIPWNQDLLDSLKIDQVSILCYHVNTDGTYPFVQYMLYNNYMDIPFLGVMEQKMVFPSIKLNPNIRLASFIQKEIQQKIETDLLSINCLVKNIEDIRLNGLLYHNSHYYLFVDISWIDINGIYLSKKNKVWFALLSEICNEESICEILIDNSVSQFFTQNDAAIHLIHPVSQEKYNIPTVVYVGGNWKQTQFQSIFGVSKTNTKYGYIYPFSLTYSDACKMNKETVEKDEDIYMKEAINRIALLIDNPIYVSQHDLPKEDVEEWINTQFTKTDSLFISESSEKTIIVIRDFEQQISLSYHKIDKNGLGGIWKTFVQYPIL